MTTYKFKTNINCGNCIKSVTPFLNELLNVEEWQVNTDHPDKILTVVLDDDNIGAVEQAIAESGFSAERF